MRVEVLLSTFLLVWPGTHGLICQDTLQKCPLVGYYPRCTDFCDTRYFICDEAGKSGVLATCPFGLVFQYDPAGVASKCVLFEDCSYKANGCDLAPFDCTGSSLAMKPSCRDCSSDFYLCDGVNAAGTELTCGTGLVFNPIPSLPGCITEDSCPCTVPPC